MPEASTIRGFPAKHNSVLCALIASLLALALIHAIPLSEIRIFARTAATIAGVFTGSSVSPTEGGWLLHILSRPVWVSKACSGTHFFLMTVAVIAWHTAELNRSKYTAIGLSLTYAFLLSTLINAVRIVCLTQVHYWIVPQVSENYTGFIHMLTGVAIFLPSLILISLTFESYANRRRQLS